MLWGHWGSNLGWWSPVKVNSFWCLILPLCNPGMPFSRSSVCSIMQNILGFVWSFFSRSNLSLTGYKVNIAELGNALKRLSSPCFQPYLNVHVSISRDAMLPINVYAFVLIEKTWWLIYTSMNWIDAVYQKKLLSAK